ncbi:MAG TPA: glycine oxidase ThiO, partial [Acidimicrobiales bacterium]
SGSSPISDVVVVGGGVVGLGVGWRAASAGMHVAVCDPAPGRGASWAAAGMLAPVTEASAAEAPLVRIGLDSLARWPAFATELTDDSGIDVGLRRDGTLQIAFDDDDRRAIGELADVHRTLGLDSEWCSTRQCRQLEPLLSPRLKGGLSVRGDWQVDSRAVVTALESAFTRRGGMLHARSVRRLLAGVDGAVTGVELDDGATLRAGTVVLAAGAHSAGIAGIPAGAVPPVRPVKGEILRLQADPAGLPFTRNIRAIVEGRAVYLVARLNGEVVVGATTQEAGFDTTVRAGAVHDLLHAAVDVVPAIEELALVEARAGLRPATPDNAPLLGPSSTPGLVIATGHYRHGMLLAPFTADTVMAVLAGGALPVEAAALHPGRFS